VRSKGTDGELFFGIDPVKVKKMATAEFLAVAEFLLGVLKV
jgi:hypothetical protein